MILKFIKENLKFIIPFLFAILLSFLLIFNTFGNNRAIEIGESSGQRNESILENKGDTNIILTKSSKGENYDTPESSIPDEVTVFITGQVNEEKVVTLKYGSRLDDAVKECGGILDTADLTRINLALKLEDEGHYHILAKDEEATEYQSSPIFVGEASKSSDTSKVNINTADIMQLQSLNGVGEKTAESIIKYRENNGPFKSIQELKNIGGIGDKKFEALKNDITI